MSTTTQSAQPGLLERLPHLHVARMKGGFVLHLIDFDAMTAWNSPAICGQHPNHNPSRHGMKQRAGWQVFKIESAKVANCKHCLAALAKVSAS